MVGSSEPNHLEREGFLSEVGGSPKANGQVNALKKNFEKVCDINNNITFVINCHDDLVLFNEAAKKFFDINDESRIIGNNFRKVFRNFPELLSYISTDADLTDTLITLSLIHI